jgi:D-3-phosphoglycerate dehydrogenase
MKKKILVTSYYAEKNIKSELDRLNGLAEIKRTSLGRKATVKEMIGYLSGVYFVIMSDDAMDSDVIRSANSLRMIGCDGVGVDSVDLSAATNKGIIVVNAPEVHEANGDFTLGLIISLVRKIVFSDRDLRADLWNQRDRFVGMGLAGKVLGLLGFGRAAKNVAKKAKAFGFNILAHSRNPDTKIAKKLDVNLVGYEELLKASDILSIHVPLTEETRGMLDSRSFFMMKAGSYLINTSRGAVIDELSLVRALKEGRIAGAALDVLVEEPPPMDLQLLAFDNVIITPHIASDSGDAFNGVFRSLVDDFILLNDKKIPKHIMNPQVLKHSNCSFLVDS